ncbi:hypothetical protein BTW08_15940 [Salinicola sp. MH3R3-1]|nr:hypothetical protein BTW08_15940 [Salinicola sp. MH3R3-1]
MRDDLDPNSLATKGGLQHVDDGSGCSGGAGRCLTIPPGLLAIGISLLCIFTSRYAIESGLLPVGRTRFGVLDSLSSIKSRLLTIGGRCLSILAGGRSVEGGLLPVCLGGRCIAGGRLAIQSGLLTVGGRGIEVLTGSDTVEPSLLSISRCRLGKLFRQRRFFDRRAGHGDDTLERGYQPHTVATGAQTCSGIGIAADDQAVTA